MELDREVRDVRSARSIFVTCSVCRTVNEVPQSGVPKFECTRCSRVLVVPPAGRARWETR